MRNRYIFPRGSATPELVPEGTRLRRYDQTSTETIDGDTGGDYAPETPIVIGGAGVRMFGTAGPVGPVETTKRAAAGGAIELGDHDYPIWTTPQTKTTVFPLRDFSNRHGRLLGSEAVMPNTFVTPLVRPVYPFDESVPGTIRNPVSPIGAFGTGTGSATRLLYRIPSVGLVQGAVIDTATLRFRVLGTPTPAGILPTCMPGFRIMRLPLTPPVAPPYTAIYTVPTRLNSTAYLVGDLVALNPMASKQFRCLTAGTSAGSSGSMSSAAIGASVTDGSVVWRAESGPPNNSPSVSPHYCRLALPATFADYFAGAQAQSITMTTRNGLVAANATIDLSLYSYWLEVFDPSTATPNLGSSYRSANAYHTLSVAMKSITAYPVTY